MASNEPHAPAGGAAAAVRAVRSGLRLTAAHGTADEQRLLLDEMQYKTGPQHAMQQRERHLQSMVFLVFVPWFMFLFTEFAVSMLPMRWLADFLAALCLACAIMMAVVYWQSKSVFYLHLSVLGVLAVSVACVCGHAIYDRSAVNYWMTRGRVSHKNVDPSEQALIYGDANSIEFTKGTRVDTLRSFGLRGLDSDGYTFCVAPVMDRALAERGEVHFWAVGRDCCQQLSGFRCGQALRPGIRSGAVVASGGGSGSNFASFKYRQFNRAAQQAASIYHLTTESRPVFLWWTEDPESALTRSLDHAFAWAALLGLLYLLISILFAGCLFGQAVHGHHFKMSLPAVQP